MTKKYITNGVAILTSTVIAHFDTADLNHQGYIENNGTDRMLCEAESADKDHYGESYWVLYADTNGDPEVLFDSQESAESFVEAMTSKNSDETPAEVVERILDSINNPALKVWATSLLSDIS